MISDKLQEAINRQINRELYSAYLYMAMAAYFDHLSLPGFAHWMKVQVQEEMAHALKLYNYLNERGGRAVMAEIEAPPARWDSPLACFQAVLEHEQKVTGLINDLMDLALAERDHATSGFLQWFVNEQVEEEASVGEVLNKLKMVENTAGGLFMLDRELAARTFTMPAGVTL
jgi:ferritin